MNKFLKIIIFFVLISFASACSYKPMFLKKSYDFKIEQINLTGDKDINSIKDSCFVNITLTNKYLLLFK